MNLARYIADAMGDEWDRRVFIAVVTGTSGNQVTITSPRVNGTFPRLVGYASPTADDEVLVIKVGPSWLVIGEVTR